MLNINIVIYICVCVLLVFFCFHKSVMVERICLFSHENWLEKNSLMSMANNYFSLCIFTSLTLLCRTLFSLWHERVWQPCTQSHRCQKPQLNKKKNKSVSMLFTIFTASRPLSPYVHIDPSCIIIRACCNDILAR